MIHAKTSLKRYHFPSRNNLSEFFASVSPRLCPYFLQVFLLPWIRLPRCHVIFLFHLPLQLLRILLLHLKYLNFNIHVSQNISPKTFRNVFTFLHMRKPTNQNVEHDDFRDDFRVLNRWSPRVSPAKKTLTTTRTGNRSKMNEI